MNGSAFRRPASMVQDMSETGMTLGVIRIERQATLRLGNCLLVFLAPQMDPAEEHVANATSSSATPFRPAPARVPDAFSSSPTQTTTQQRQISARSAMGCREVRIERDCPIEELDGPVLLPLASASKNPPRLEE